MGRHRAAPSRRRRRIQTNFLAAGERTLLDRLCRSLPGWVTPDRLTAVGWLGAALAALGYVACHWRPEFLFLASLGVAINWFGDSLDGSLARHRGVARPRYGYFLDHSVDALSMLVFAVGLGFSPYVNMTAALFWLCGYYLLGIQVFLSAQVNREFHLARVYVGPTELRLLTIAFNTAIYWMGPRTLTFGGSTVSVYSAMVLLEGVAFVTLFILDLYSTADKLRRQETRANAATAAIRPSGQR